jgi:hypothetical protein
VQYRVYRLGGTNFQEYQTVVDSASKVLDTGLYAVLTESQLYEYFEKPKRGDD